jgi:RND family efflux transporter MFP subunit
MVERATRCLSLALVLLVGCALTACDKVGSGGKAPAAVVAPAALYATIANGKVDIEGGVIEVAARRPGVISEVLAQEGDVVKKGQVLARLEDRDAVLAINTAKAAVAQARSELKLSDANLGTAKRELQRLQKLLATNLVSQQQLDQAADSVVTAEAQRGIRQAAIEAAEARLAEAEYNLELTAIRAPMDGKIIRRYANPGSGASTLNVSTMFDLEPDIAHIIRSEIVESAIPDVFIGQTAEIVPEADPSRKVIGRVLRIAATFGARKLKSDTANEASDERVVEVVVSADDESFLIGQRVLVKFLKPAGPSESRESSGPSR